MFVRFVISDLDPDSGRRQGLFQAADDVRERGDMSEADVEKMDALYAWFKANLAAPTRFALSSRPHAKVQALSWFRDSATEHVSRMREYGHIMASYGVPVEMLRTKRPGYVVFEDQHQVVAYPFADTPC